MAPFDRNLAGEGLFGKRERVFCLVALSAPNKKITSQRPFRLCGEDFRAKRLRKERIGIWELRKIGRSRERGGN
jgi:hypothetical protein